MSALSLSHVAKETGGQLLGDASFVNVCTDTRSLQQGDLFVALGGDNFDGNRFVAAAANGGACAAIISADADVDIPTVQVTDTRMALGIIARMNRRQFNGPVIALTGSAGKTTTKEMVASILAEMGAVLATKANLNNEIGVPLTLLAIDKQHDYAVVEMGASRAGDIAYLTQFAEPTISVLTNAMPVHIEGFGNVETIAKTKGEIFECLPANGAAVINLDDRFCSQWRQQAGAAVVTTFSKANTAADFYASEIQLHNTGVTSFNLHAQGKNIAINLGLLGEHNIVNALAASVAAVAAGASLAQLKLGLEKVQPVSGRLKPFVHSGQTIIDDSYNASPGSVKAAIDVLAGFTGMRCLVLGTMGELGDMASASHREVAVYAREKGIEQFVMVGEYAELAVAAFGAGGRAYVELDQLLSALDVLMPSSVILIKGSRSARMERAVDALLISKEGEQ